MIGFGAGFASSLVGQVADLSGQVSDLSHQRIRANSATLIAFMMIAGVGAANPPAPATPTASVRDAVYFGPAGPVRIRFLLSIGGRPADTVWTEAIDGLFAFCDRNGDGVLDPTERAIFSPPTDRRRELDLLAQQERAARALILSFGPKEEKISRAAFAEAVRNSGRGAISLRIVPTRADSRKLSAALFHHLDQNDDGRLSVDELKAARERLAHLDIDEDEFITAAELLGRGVGANNSRVRQVVPGGPLMAEPGEPSVDLLFLAEDETQGVKQLLTTRGSGRATSLKPTEFGADAKTFAALDRDGNGVLDATELAAWLRRPPDLEVVVSVDSSSGRLTTALPAQYQAEKDGAVSAALPGGRFRFELPGDNAAREWAHAVAVMRDEFMAHTHEKGFVERKQVEKQPTDLTFFDFADRKGAGKLDSAGVEAALKVLAPLGSCRIDIQFVDFGNGLFELLDRDNDGRLSPRELVESVSILKPFTGADGCVGPKDLVRRFHIRPAVQSIEVALPIPPTVSTQAKSQSNVPAWFTRMDRNGDGEVSLREFVGPIELFRKLDRDGDGLISPEEARAAGK
jgi:Ca2+-binding EF-hand superfamily protein